MPRKGGCRFIWPIRPAARGGKSFNFLGLLGEYRRSPSTSPYSDYRQRRHPLRKIPLSVNVGLHKSSSNPCPNPLWVLIQSLLIYWLALVLTPFLLIPFLLIPFLCRFHRYPWVLL